MSRIKTHVRKGDLVEVISGGQLYDYEEPADPSQPVIRTKRTPEQRRGKVLAVFPAKNQVLIEGLRMIKKHQRKSQQVPEGGIIEREGPIHISNVRLVEEPAKAAPKAKKKK
ncbi:MAG: 50S ribosomal protein L24 [Verrucomicrobiales bacterium]